MAGVVVGAAFSILAGFSVEAGVSVRAGFSVVAGFSVEAREGAQGGWYDGASGRNGRFEARRAADFWFWIIINSSSCTTRAHRAEI